jgi:hypothetical protein
MVNNSLAPIQVSLQEEISASREVDCGRNFVSRHILLKGENHEPVLLPSLILVGLRLPT